MHKNDLSQAGLQLGTMFGMNFADDAKAFAKCERNTLLSAFAKEDKVTLLDQCSSTILALSPEGFF